jgi:hypothetical protein
MSLVIVGHNYLMQHLIFSVFDAAYASSVGDLLPITEDMVSSGDTLFMLPVRIWSIGVCTTMLLFRPQKSGGCPFSRTLKLCPQTARRTYSPLYLLRAYFGVCSQHPSAAK